MLFYDFEVFKHDWLVVIYDMVNQVDHVIVNDMDKLSSIYHANKENIWIGYNSKHYDQWILKGILCEFDPKEISDFIIEQKKNGYQFSSLLNKIQLLNFDIMVAMTGLKTLEGFMGHNIKESSVDFNIDRKLTEEELQEVIKYCRHDVEQTIEVFLQTKEEFDSQLSLIKAFNLPLSYLSKSKPQLSAIILGANRVHGRDDEFDLIIPNTLKLGKYKYILDWYLDPNNRNYKNELCVDVAGVPHKFAWGGLHGARDKYHGEGYFLNIDVASFYPALMIEYGFISRNISNPNKYREIRDTRLELKKKKDPKQAPYKIVLNSTYGAMKDKFNALYDPRQANNVCIGGQLLLLDLIEKLEPYCMIIQSNTDGVLLKLNHIDDYDLIDDICYEWEKRTRMELEFEQVAKVYQKDVNNYITVDLDGNYKSKGAYVKKLSDLDYDLPIVNHALKEYLIKKIHPRDTINSCDDLREFQKIVKVSSAYKYAMHNGIKLKEKTFRVFASNNEKDGILYKCKENKNPEKFANTPERAFIYNDDVKGVKCPRKLDKQWYIDLAIKRLEDFGVKL